MPELPSVERGRRLLEEYLVGKQVNEVYALESGGGPREGLYDDLVFKNIVRDEVVLALQGRTITASKRKGKYLWISLGDKGTKTAKRGRKRKRVRPNRYRDVCFHFGMTGNVNIKGVKQREYAREKKQVGDQWPPKFSKLTMKMDDGTEFAFTTPRRIARISFHDSIEEEEPVSKLGFDPLTGMLSLGKFKDCILKLKGNIKKNLLDQSFICGIGNWICDDVLFASAIHPTKQCMDLRDDEIKRLHKSIVNIIQKACKVNADKTLFPTKWLFHYRWTKAKAGVKYPPLNKTIKFIKVAGRTTAIIPDIQKLGKKRISK